MGGDERTEDWKPIIILVRPSIVDATLILLQLFAVFPVNAKSYIGKEHCATRGNFLLPSLKDCSFEPLLVVPSINDLIYAAYELVVAPIEVLLGLLASRS